MKLSSVFLLLSALAFGLTNSFSQSKPLFSVLKGRSLTDKSCRVGFIDEAGNLRIDFKFYYASEFSDGLAAIILTKGGKWGYADETGTIIIEPQFDEASSFSSGLAKITNDGKTFFISKDGKNSLDTSLILFGFHEGLSPAQLLGKWGFVNQTGKVIIPFKFQSANPFYEKLAAVTLDGLVGYIDRSGNWVIQPRFSLMRGYSDQLFLPNFSEGLAVYRDKDKYGFINATGITVIPATFDRAESFSEGLALVGLNEKVGYLKKDGQYAIEPKFESGQRFSNGLASVRIGGKWGYVDTVGSMQIQPQYDSAEPFKSGLAKVSKHMERDGSTTVSYIDRNGKAVYSWEQ